MYPCINAALPQYLRLRSLLSTGWLIVLAFVSVCWLIVPSFVARGVALVSRLGMRSRGSFGSLGCRGIPWAILYPVSVSFLPSSVCYSVALWRSSPATQLVSSLVLLLPVAFGFALTWPQ